MTKRYIGRVPLCLSYTICKAQVKGSAGMYILTETSSMVMITLSKRDYPQSKAQNVWYDRYRTRRSNDPKQWS